MVALERVRRGRCCSELLERLFRALWHQKSMHAQARSREKTRRTGHGPFPAAVSIVVARSVCILRRRYWRQRPGVSLADTGAQATTLARLRPILHVDGGTWRSVKWLISLPVSVASVTLPSAVSHGSGRRWSRRGERLRGGRAFWRSLLTELEGQKNVSLSQAQHATASWLTFVSIDRPLPSPSPSRSFLRRSESRPLLSCPSLSEGRRLRSSWWSLRFERLEDRSALFST